MNALMTASYLVLMATAFADEQKNSAEEIDPQRMPLWNGRAPVGDGQFQDGDAWIAVHRPAKGNGTAIVICPGGGYGGLMTDPE